MIYFIVNNFHHKKQNKTKIMKILIVPHLYTPTSLHRNVFSLVGIHPDFFCAFTYKTWVLNEYINWNIHWKTDAEAETPILWPPDAKSQLIGQVPDAGKD